MAPEQMLKLRMYTRTQYAHDGKARVSAWFGDVNSSLRFVQVLGKSPIERFENILPEVMLQCEARLSHIREGYLALMACLPNTMGPALESFIPKILPTILSGQWAHPRSISSLASRAVAMRRDTFSIRVTRGHQ